MALNISAGAIRNPIPPIVLFLALLFAGLTAYDRLPINQLPNIEFPVVIVTVAQPGAAPGELETQVTQRAEAALTGVQGVKRITSTVSPGVSQTVIELQSGTDVSRAVEDARDAMTRIRSELPADVQEPVIQRDAAAAEPIAYMAVEWAGKTDRDLSWFIDNELSRELLAVKGLSQIRRLGGVNREVRIELDPERLVALGITAADVSRQLRSQNADLPGGRAEVGGQAQSIRTLGGADTVEGLADSRVVLVDGRSVRLADLGRVVDAQSELAAVSRYNGQPVISFLVQRAKGSSEVDVYDGMTAKLDALEEENPGLNFRVLGTPVNFVKGLKESSEAALIEGALLAVLVVLLILRDWRATVIAALAIPLAILPTFAAIEPMGFTLNMITFIALGLVAGVLVDDAIVEIENIVRHIRMGKSAYQAALEAADEIGLAVVATSATIIVVFVPVSFMTGTTGQFFKEFGITVAFAVFFSLLVARLITPMMAAFFLKGGHAERPPGALTNTYLKALGWAIRRPFIAAAMGLAVFIASLAPVVLGLVPMTFIPRLDNGSIAMSVEFPPGTPLANADRTLSQLAAKVRQVKEVEGVFISANAVDGGVSSGSLNVQLVPRNDRKRSANEIEQELRPLVSNAPDVRVSFLQFQGGGRGADITLEYVGDDPDALRVAADNLVAKMRTMSELADVKSSASLVRPEIQITPRADAASRLGVSAADLASAVRVATGGDVDQNLPKFTLPDRQIPIRVLLRPDARTDLETIRALRVRTGTGEAIRLDAVAEVRFGAGEAAIERRDRQRKVTVSANVVQGEIGDAIEKAMALPEASKLPAGISLLPAGSTEDLAELVGNFGNAMLWGILLIYGVLVLLFRDFFQPFTIMTALPLSIGGAFVGLLVFGQPLSLFVFIGFLMLMGIVTKNSILLVDFAIEEIRRGKSRNQALMEAGAKRSRPIVMTTIAMSAGMIPAAAGWGVDGALRQGMGVAVIGGLILSTLLSLVFVPAVFVLVDRFERVVKPFFGRVSTRQSDPAVRHPAE
ncbi:MAG: efflux RND transporter permease subunit [Hyphomonadaceae bacterium]|nr:MAG: acriflavin resistance protein [Caulobacteraceae bacterium]MBT9445776.1 efflux RND transporter permease subunit [Hyphomonadaceae bacterium]TPW06221.1 MAG: acriflavin resistance protein [Alphaproteobacteria bacterium]